VIHRLLIANRGEIAARVIRTCTRLGIESVLAASDADLDSLPARLADRVVRLGPASASANSPLPVRNSTTVPRTPACTGVIIFMVSTIPTTVSSSTWSPTSTNGGAPGCGAR